VIRSRVIADLEAIIVMEVVMLEIEKLIPPLCGPGRFNLIETRKK
jgi:hypothetical protein